MELTPQAELSSEIRICEIDYECPTDELTLSWWRWKSIYHPRRRKWYHIRRDRVRDAIRTVLGVVSIWGRCIGKEMWRVGADRGNCDVCGPIEQLGRKNHGWWI